MPDADQTKAALILEELNALAGGAKPGGQGGPIDLGPAAYMLSLTVDQRIERNDEAQRVI